MDPEATIGTRRKNYADILYWAAAKNQVFKNKFNSIALCNVEKVLPEDTVKRRDK